MDSPARITFPEPYKVGQRFRIQLRSTEEMNVVGHDDVSANSPSMSFVSRAPFINKNFGDLVGSKKLPTIFGARCDEINWSINPNAPKSSQVLMHTGVGAEGGDLGNLRRSYVDNRGQRPRLQG